MIRFCALRGVVTTALLLAAVASGQAQQWPTRPIRVISPFPAGSASDTTSRIVLDQISQLLGRPMVIEGRPGAGGRLGFAEVAKAEPDGYTLVTSSSSMASGLVLHKSLPYDPVRDFIAVALFGIQPNVLVASTQSGFKTIADLVAAAKAKPATLTFASAGIGSNGLRLSTAFFQKETGTQFTMVPYRGVAPAMQTSWLVRSICCLVDRNSCRWCVRATLKPMR